jgi:hypothetical protein
MVRSPSATLSIASLLTISATRSPSSAWTVCCFVPAAAESFAVTSNASGSVSGGCPATCGDDEHHHAQ